MKLFFESFNQAVYYIVPMLIAGFFIAIIIGKNLKKVKPTKEYFGIIRIK
jgi:hypothetical protein